MGVIHFPKHTTVEDGVVRKNRKQKKEESFTGPRSGEPSTRVALEQALVKQKGKNLAQMRYVRAIKASLNVQAMSSELLLVLYNELPNIKDKLDAYHIVQSHGCVFAEGGTIRSIVQGEMPTYMRAYSEHRALRTGFRVLSQHVEDIMEQKGIHKPAVQTVEEFLGEDENAPDPDKPRAVDLPKNPSGLKELNAMFVNLRDQKTKTNIQRKKLALSLQGIYQTARIYSALTFHRTSFRKAWETKELALMKRRNVHHQKRVAEFEDELRPSTYVKKLKDKKLKRTVGARKSQIGSSHGEVTEGDDVHPSQHDRFCSSKGYKAYDAITEIIREVRCLRHSLELLDAEYVNLDMPLMSCVRMMRMGQDGPAFADAMEDGNRLAWESMSTMIQIHYAIETLQCKLNRCVSHTLGARGSQIGSSHGEVTEGDDMSSAVPDDRKGEAYTSDQRPISDRSKAAEALSDAKQATLGLEGLSAEAAVSKSCPEIADAKKDSACASESPNPDPTPLYDARPDLYASQVLSWVGDGSVDNVLSKRILPDSLKPWMEGNGPLPHHIRPSTLLDESWKWFKRTTCIAVPLVISGSLSFKKRDGYDTAQVIFMSEIIAVMILICWYMWDAAGDNNRVNHLVPQWDGRTLGEHAEFNKGVVLYRTRLDPVTLKAPYAASSSVDARLPHSRISKLKVHPSWCNMVVEMLVIEPKTRKTPKPVILHKAIIDMRFALDTYTQVSNSVSMSISLSITKAGREDSYNHDENVHHDVVDYAPYYYSRAASKRSDGHHFLALLNARQSRVGPSGSAGT